MDSSIVVAVIMAMGTIGTQLVILKKQERAQDVKLQHSLELYEQKTDMIIAEIKHDLKRLEEKQNKHNNLIERMTIVERDLKTAWRNIDDIKGHSH